MVCEIILLGLAVSDLYQASTRLVPFQSCMYTCSGCEAGFGKMQMGKLRMAKRPFVQCRAVGQCLSGASLFLLDR